MINGPLRACFQIQVFGMSTTSLVEVGTTCALAAMSSLVIVSKVLLAACSNELSYLVGKISMESW